MNWNHGWSSLLDKSTTTHTPPPVLLTQLPLHLCPKARCCQAYYFQWTRKQRHCARTLAPWKWSPCLEVGVFFTQVYTLAPSQRALERLHLSKVGGGDTVAAFCSQRSTLGFITWSYPALGDSNLVVQGRDWGMQIKNNNSMGNYDIQLKWRTSRTGQSDGNQFPVWLTEKGEECLPSVMRMWWCDDDNDKLVEWMNEVMLPRSLGIEMLPDYLASSLEVNIFTAFAVLQSHQESHLLWKVTT